MTTVIVQPGTSEATYQITVEINDTIYQVGASFGVGPRGPAGVNMTGPWDSATEYAVDDGVYRNGSSYWARQSSSGVDPEVDVNADTGLGTYWNLMAAEGKPGPVSTVDGVEPVDGNVPLGALRAANNLSDVDDAATARGNIGAVGTDDNRLAPTPTTTDAGKVVTVKADGSGYELGDESGGGLTFMSGSISQTTLSSTVATAATISSLTAGTWQINVGCQLNSSGASIRTAQIQAVAGTGTPTLSGRTVAETKLSTTANGVTEGELTLTFLATCTATSTVTIQGIADNSGVAIRADTPTEGVSSGASGWTAVKIA